MCAACVPSQVTVRSARRQPPSRHMRSKVSCPFATAARTTSVAPRRGRRPSRRRHARGRGAGGRRRRRTCAAGRARGRGAASGASRSSRSGAHSRAAHATSQTAEPGLGEVEVDQRHGAAAGEDHVVEVRVVVADDAAAERAPARPAARRGGRRRTTPPRRGSARSSSATLTSASSVSAQSWYGSIAASPGMYESTSRPRVVDPEEARRAVEARRARGARAARASPALVGRWGRRTVSPTRVTSPALVKPPRERHLDVAASHVSRQFEELASPSRGG